VRRRCRHAGAEEDGGIFERGAGADGDGFGGAYAGALQGRGDAIHHRVQRGEGDAALALDQGRVLRAHAGAGADQLAIVGEGAGEQLAETHSILGGAGSRRRYMP
jgi:hypothetical protein